MSRFQAILRMRCPRCLTGRVFVGTFRMNETCPDCGHRFNREPGYFLGAMYFSYPIAAVVLGLLAVLVQQFVLPASRLDVALAVAFLPFLLVVPAIFRYSRILWMHFDTPND